MHAVPEADGGVHCGDEGDALPSSMVHRVHTCCDCWLLAEQNQAKAKGGKGKERPVSFDIKMVPGRVLVLVAVALSLLLPLTLLFAVLSSIAMSTLLLV